MTCIVVNMDHGVIPACTFELKKELDINDFFLGILGSLVFAGLMTGSLISGVLYTKFNCKKIILISLFAVLLGLLLFPISGKNKWLLGAARLISGFFQVFLIIYFPVWVDTFGGKHKTQWLSYL